MCDMHRVLLVDDDRDIVRGLSIRLRAAGYAVDTAYNGQAGLDAAQQTAPDVIVLDLRMPVMDGMTALARLRETPATQVIPVIVVSANAAGSERSQALELGARCFVEKPYDSKELISRIQSVLEKKQRRPTAS